MFDAGPQPSGARQHLELPPLVRELDSLVQLPVGGGVDAGGGRSGLLAHCCSLLSRVGVRSHTSAEASSLGMVLGQRRPLGSPASAA